MGLLRFLPSTQEGTLASVLFRAHDHKKQQSEHNAMAVPRSVAARGLRLDLRPPRTDSEQEPSGSGAIHCRDRLGGLIREYYRAAA
jgi:hypothetical protein